MDAHKGLHSTESSDIQRNNRWQSSGVAEWRSFGYSFAMMLVALALSYLTIPCHIAYKTLSHLYYFNILGGVKLSYVVSTTRCILSSFVWNVAQTTSWSGLSNRIYIRLECASEGIYPWTFHDRIIKKTHEVTRCKQPLYVDMQATL